MHLGEAVADPDTFLRTLATSTGEAARHFAIARLGARVLPLLQAENLSPADIEDSVTQLEGLDELRQAANDPMGFVRSLHSSAFYRSRHVLPEMLEQGLLTVRLKCAPDGTTGVRGRPTTTALEYHSVMPCAEVDDSDVYVVVN